MGQKLPLKVQLCAMMKNKPYLLALLGQLLFGFIHYGRNADMLYYFTYVEGSATLFSFYSMAIIVPSIIGAACFPWYSERPATRVCCSHLRFPHRCHYDRSVLLQSQR